MLSITSGQAILHVLVFSCSRVPIPVSVEAWSGGAAVSNGQQ